MTGADAPRRHAGSIASCWCSLMMPKQNEGHAQKREEIMTRKSRLTTLDGGVAWMAAACCRRGGAARQRTPPGSRGLGGTAGRGWGATEVGSGSPHVRMIARVTVAGRRRRCGFRARRCVRDRAGGVRQRPPSRIAGAGSLPSRRGRSVPLTFGGKGSVTVAAGAGGDERPGRAARGGPAASSAVRPVRPRLAERAAEPRDDDAVR